MKRVILLATALMLLFTLIACQNNEDKETDIAEKYGLQPPVQSTDNEGVKISNPIVQVEGSANFEELGFVIDAPETATNQVYGIINNEVAQIKFNLDEKDFTLRCSKTITGQELHGMYVQFEGEALSLEADGVKNSLSIEVKAIKDGGAVATAKVNFTDGEIYYLSLVTEEKIDKEKTSEMLMEISGGLLTEK